MLPGVTTCARERAVIPYRYALPPVTGVILYKNDAVVVRKGQGGHSVDWTRSEVTTFSKASRQRLAFVASNTDVRFTSMITLTYPREFPSDGKEVKRNLNAFLVTLRRKAEGLEYLWFLEFQRRGAPHIHLLLRGVRVYKPMQRWVSETWYRLCATGDERHLRAGTRLELIRKPDGARNYCVKYAFKMKQKVVPELYRNIGRFWGHSKSVRPVARSAHRCTNDDLIGALEAVGWDRMHSDIVRWRTLYGAGVLLTLRWFGAKLELSSSGSTDLKSRKREGSTV